MQAILGSGGAIGTELAKALPQYTNELVSQSFRRFDLVMACGHPSVGKGFFEILR